ARPDPELEPAAREGVDGGRLLSGQRRVAEVVVEDEGANAQRAGSVRRDHQRRQRRQLLSEVVRYQERGVAEGFCLLRELAPLSERLRSAEENAEAKLARERAHAGAATNCARRSSVASHQFASRGSSTPPDRWRYSSGASTPGGTTPCSSSARAAAINRRRVRMISASVVPRCSIDRSRIGPIDSVTAMSCWRMPGIPV